MLVFTDVFNKNVCLSCIIFMCLTADRYRHEIYANTRNNNVFLTYRMRKR